MKKYEFTEETLTHRREDGSEVILHRIRALRDLDPPMMDGSAHAGDLGGFLEKEENLSHDGECWVDEQARVLDDARVEEDAYVCDHAQVSGRAVISGKGVVSDGACVKGQVTLTEGSVEGSSVLYGYITISADVTLRDVSLSTPVVVESTDPEDDDELKSALENAFRLTISSGGMAMIQPHFFDWDDEEWTD